ncbi:MAG: hypothetical protein AB7F89_15670, partial [Pirellulaceae bacterium]
MAQLGVFVSRIQLDVLAIAMFGAPSRDATERFFFQVAAGLLSVIVRRISAPVRSSFPHHTSARRPF